MLTYIVLFFFLVCLAVGLPLMMNVWGKVNDVAAAARLQLNEPAPVRIVYLMATPPACQTTYPSVPPDPCIDIDPV